MIVAGGMGSNKPISINSHGVVYFLEGVVDMLCLFCFQSTAQAHKANPSQHSLYETEQLTQTGRFFLRASQKCGP